METLANLAEISITIAGFSALITLLQEKKSSWTFNDKANLNRFYIMVEVSLITCVISYLPILLTGYFSENRALQLASFSFPLLLPTYGAYVMRRNRRLTGKKNPSGKATILMRIYTFLIAFFATLNGLRLLGSRYVENYLIFTFLLLCFSFYFFLGIIYTSVKVPSEENQV